MSVRTSRGTEQSARAVALAHQPRLCRRSVLVVPGHGDDATTLGCQAAATSTALAAACPDGSAIRRRPLSQDGPTPAELLQILSGQVQLLLPSDPTNMAGC